MRKRYVSHWHGIRFDEFTVPSSTRFVDREFYRKYYTAFLARYKSKEEVPGAWLGLKRQAAALVQSRFPQKGARILSIGCGLGMMEERLFEQGYRGIEVTEVVSEPLAWLNASLGPGRIHIGTFPGCVPESAAYDLIYLAGVECLFTDEELVLFLRDVRGRLAAGGRCMVISWTCEPGAAAYRISAALKDALEASLERMGVRKRGQFFGYSRTAGEFPPILKAAGFGDISCGTLERVCERQTFWIEAGKESDGT